MSDNKLVKTFMDAGTIIIFVTGIGWIAKNVVKENFITDPSSSFSSFGKFTLVMAGAIALKDYLVDKKILPANV